MSVVEMNKEEIDHSYEISLRAARRLVRSHVDMVVLGGVPVNISRGFANVDDLIRNAPTEIGRPFFAPPFVPGDRVKALRDALTCLDGGRLSVNHRCVARKDK